MILWIEERISSELMGMVTPEESQVWEVMGITDPREVES